MNDARRALRAARLVLERLPTILPRLVAGATTTDDRVAIAGVITEVFGAGATPRHGCLVADAVVVLSARDPSIVAAVQRAARCRGAA